MNESRIIVPLDGMERSYALELASMLSGSVWGFKVNDLLIDCGVSIIEELKELGQVMADPKLFDIPNTVKNACVKLASAGADLITVHAAGGYNMIFYAAEGAGQSKILAVTVLTSFDDSSCQQSYKTSVAKTFNRLARLALEAGVGGLVCSGHELSAVSGLCDIYEEGEEILRVVPGIRPSVCDQADDQARKMTPGRAIQAGASLLVIGRPIYGADDPLAAAAAINEEINAALN